MIKRGIVVGVAVLAVALVTPTPASAAAWSIVPSPNPPGPAAGPLNAIACASATDCVAVGGYQSGYSASVLIEHWDGTTWKVVPTTTQGQLFGVACPSTTMCVAVGWAANNSLAMRWDGVAWTAESGLPTAAPSSLKAVTCPTTTRCFAAGARGGGGGSLLIQWDGSSWSAINSGDGQSGGELNGIACASASQCTAVGDFAGKSSGPPLIKQWDGGAWTTTFVPASGTPQQLDGVSCPSTTMCVAVGVQTVATWNGATWSFTSAPLVTGATVELLTGVSCASTTSCVAVGLWRHYPDQRRTLALHLEGGAWSVKPTLSSSHDSNANGVACVTSTHCTLVGNTTPNAIIENWNGSAWTFATPAIPGSQSRLTGIACPTSNTCMAVGSYDTQTDTRPLGMLVSGGSATVKPAVLPAGSPQAWFAGVACTAANLCIAVGGYDANGHRAALSERWNGSTWSILATPSPAGNVELRGVSCPAVGDCTAVGFADTSTGTDTEVQPLVLHFNGTTWTRVTAPVIPHPGGRLDGVSCAASTMCQAVGSASNKGLIERWNGHAWSVLDSPPASYAAVSCPTTSRCLAVGGAAVPAAAKMNGSTWTSSRPITPSGSGSTVLSGVSCDSTTSCTAVGQSASNTGFAWRTLIEHWNGASWSILSSLNRLGAPGNGLSGVSCTSATNCWSVGSSWAPPFGFGLLEHDR
jgi:hypothetical protein